MGKKRAIRIPQVTAGDVAKAFSAQSGTEPKKIMAAGYYGLEADFFIKDPELREEIVSQYEKVYGVKIDRTLSQEDQLVQFKELAGKKK
jgi:hypothetical protein